METQSQGAVVQTKGNKARENQCAMEHPLRPPQSLDTVNMVHIPRVRPLPHQDRSPNKRVNRRRGRTKRKTTQREVNHRHKHLPPTADIRRSNRQNKAKANREQLMVIEIDTHSGPEMRQQAEPHELHRRRVDKARHARAIEECDVAQPPVLQLQPLDKAQHLHPTTAPDALQTNCAWETTPFKTEINSGSQKSVPMNKETSLRFNLTAEERTEACS